MAGDAVDLGLLGHRDRGIGGGDPEQAPRQRQLLLVGGGLGELLRHLEIRGAAEHQVARLGQADDDDRLLGGEAALGHHQGLHGPRLVGAHVLVGVGDAAEQVGEAREVSGPIRFEMFQRLDQVTERPLVRRVQLPGAEPEPAADGVEGHGVS